MPLKRWKLTVEKFSSLEVHLMNRLAIWLAPCAALALAAIATAAHAATLEPLATTGHDQDIVFESGLTDGAAGATGELGSRQFFQDGAVAADDDGLPPTLPTFVSALTGDSINYAFQPFNENNILKFDSAAPVKSLTLTTPAAYRKLAVVFSGGSLGTQTELGQLPYTINHTGGAKQTGTLQAPDWGAVTTLPAGVERLFTADRTTANATAWPISSDNNTTANRWAIYVSVIDVANLGANITSIVFGPASLLTIASGATGPLNSGDDVAVFGISGAPVPEPSAATLSFMAAMNLAVHRRKRLTLIN
jgi:hypothetical protein